MASSSRDHELARFAESLQRCLPDMSDIAPLAYIGEGFRSVAVETVGGILFRIGKVEEASAGFELEKRVLPVVRQHVTAPVPDPLWHVEPCDDFPFGALGYVKLPGSIPVPGDAALAEFFIPELARFMVELHSIPVGPMLAAGAPTVQAMKRIRGAQPVVMPLLADRISRDQFARLERWWDDLPADSDADSRRSVCHHDLWHENLLVDSAGRLSGALDWSHVEIGDPAHDFAAIHHFGPRLTARLISEYRSAGGNLSDSDLERVRVYWEARHLGGLAWAIENDVQDEIDSGIEKLLTGPILG